VALKRDDFEFDDEDSLDDNFNDEEEKVTEGF
jgi:hypothetical protein